MLKADEVAHHLAGSLRLLNKDSAGLERFAVSIDAFWRSFLAVTLTAPAFILVIASDRVRLGLPLQDGLFSEPGIVAVRLVAACIAWLAFPLLMIGVCRALGLGHRYVGYIIVYNWSAVITTSVLAVPSGAFALGWVPGELVALFAVGFAAVIFHYRWFVARTALGVSGGLAALLAFGDLGLVTVVEAAVRAAL